MKGNIQYWFVKLNLSLNLRSLVINAFLSYDWFVKKDGDWSLCVMLTWTLKLKIIDCK